MGLVLSFVGAPYEVSPATQHLGRLRFAQKKQRRADQPAERGTLKRKSADSSRFETPGAPRAAKGRGGSSHGRSIPAPAPGTAADAPRRARGTANQAANGAERDSAARPAPTARAACPAAAH